MQKKHILLTITLLFLFLNSLQSQPKREVRAVWITTAYSLDWPQTLARTPHSRAQQQREMIQLLDYLKAANINTILFQVRGRGDATYPSSYEPFSTALTCNINGDPGYDPLQFVVEECHKRGMECHAWVVAIPMGSVSQQKKLGNSSPTKRVPQVCVRYKSAWYLNPGHPNSKYYLADIVKELVTRYDLDGIHFDYLRYPNGAPNFPDIKEYKAYGKGKDLAEWRRDNLTQILAQAYKEIKAIKPWVKVSTCPVGKHSDTNRYPSKGWNAFYEVHQDVFKWVELGIQDQIYPMMYHQGNSFYPFALDWQENSQGKQVIAGLGIYFLDDSEGGWPAEEIQRQLYFARDNNLAGQAFFRAQFLVNDTKGVYSSLKNKHYKYPALIPPITGCKPEDLPKQPTHIEVLINKDCAYIHWQKPANSKQDVKYVLYKSPTYPVDTSDPKNIVATYIQDTVYTYTPVISLDKYAYYAVTAIDRYGNESEATQLKSKRDIEIEE